MNALEQQLGYPFGDTLPAPGHAIEVARGVKWLRMGLPFALDHINLWLLRDRHHGREGWAIVDCGITDDATRANWERIFATELDGLPVLRVICTHMHPDHIGLAHWLTERWSTPETPCDLWISSTDWHAATLASRAESGMGGDAAADHFARHGITDEASLDKLRNRTRYFSSMVPRVPKRYHRLMDGQRLVIGANEWACHAGYGHAPEHMALHCAGIVWPGAAAAAPVRGSGVLIAGDMVLPRISTNVMVVDLEPEADPLSLYLASIERMRSVPADTLVLPSHGRPFTGLHTRIDQLQAHHDDRLAEVMAACAAAPCTAAQLLPVLFKRTLDLHQTTFAMGEAIAHLHLLWFQGRLERQRGEDGVLRFTAA